jgi:hypothetical protein
MPGNGYSVGRNFLSEEAAKHLDVLSIIEEST